MDRLNVSVKPSGRLPNNCAVHWLPLSVMSYIILVYIGQLCLRFSWIPFMKNSLSFTPDSV
jgi:hypothetical protein